MANKFVDQNGLLYFWQKILAKFQKKEDGKGLSTNDYTTDEKNKLAGIEAGANKITVVDNLTSDSAEAALSANQGKVLDEKIKSINDNIADLGGGDMLKSVYDIDNNGKVDNADNADNANKLNGQSADYYAKATDVKDKFSQLTNDGAVQYTAQSLSNEQKAQARTNIGAGTSSFSGSYNDLTDKPTDFAPTEHTHETSEVTGLDAALSEKVNKSALGQANGVATLDGTGLIPSTQLPSYVDDVVEGYAKTSISDGGVVTVDGFYKEAEFTTAIAGESGKIYVDISTNISYRYGGTTFVQITSSDMTALTNAEIDTIVGS